MRQLWRCLTGFAEFVPLRDQWLACLLGGVLVWLGNIMFPVLITDPPAYHPVDPTSQMLSGGVMALGIIIALANFRGGER